MINIEKVRISELNQSDVTLLLLELSFFPNQNSEIECFLNTKEEFQSLNFDVKNYYDKNLCYYIYEELHVLDIIVKGIEKNNYAIPLMILDSEYESSKNFCKDWVKHFNFKDCRIKNDCI